MNMKQFRNIICMSAATFLITSCKEEPPPPPPAPVETKTKVKPRASVSSSNVLSRKDKNSRNEKKGLGGATLKRDDKTKKKKHSFGSSSSLSRGGKGDSKTSIQGTK